LKEGGGAGEGRHVVMLRLEEFGNIFGALGFSPGPGFGLAVALDSLRRICPIVA